MTVEEAVRAILAMLDRTGRRSALRSTLAGDPKVPLHIAAEVLDASPRTVRRWVELGTEAPLKIEQTGPRGLYWVELASLAARYIADRQSRESHESHRS